VLLAGYVLRDLHDGTDFLVVLGLDLLLRLLLVALQLFLDHRLHIHVRLLQVVLHLLELFPLQVAQVLNVMEHRIQLLQVFTLFMAEVVHLLRKLSPLLAHQGSPRVYREVVRVLLKSVGHCLLDFRQDLPVLHHLRRRAAI